MRVTTALLKVAAFTFVALPVNAYLKGTRKNISCSPKDESGREAASFASLPIYCDMIETQHDMYFSSRKVRLLWNFRVLKQSLSPSTGYGRTCSMRIS